MKKAQGISVNVIIIAAIALLVLVVLSVIFIGRMGGWGKETNSCISNGGRCMVAGSNSNCGDDAQDTQGNSLIDYKMPYPIWSCTGDTETVKLCCIKAGP